MNSFKYILDFIEACKYSSGDGVHYATLRGDVAIFVRNQKTVEVSEHGITLYDAITQALDITWDQIPMKYRASILELLSEDDIDWDLHKKIRSFFS